MATKMLKPTAVTVSRLLTNAYFSKSETSTTRIRGWHNISAGFKVSKRVVGDGCIVEHITDRWATNKDMIRDAKLAKYKEALDLHFSVELVSNGRDAYLRISAKSETAC